MTINPRELMMAFLEVRNAFDRCSEVFLAEFGLTAAQLNILNLVGDEGGTTIQAAVSQQVLIGKSSLSIVIDRMVERGYLRRQTSTKDRRRVILALTPVGRRLWEKVHPLYMREVDRIFGIIPVGKRKALREGWRQIESQLRERRAALSP